RRCRSSSRFATSVSLNCCTCSLRSEEHTSELQSLTNLVCRLLLEKKILRKAEPRCGTCGCGRRPRHSGSSRGGRPGGADGLGLLPQFFFFKRRGAPRLLPFSPTGPFPI